MYRDRRRRGGIPGHARPKKDADAAATIDLSDSPDQISLYILDEVAERPRQSIEFPKND